MINRVLHNPRYVGGQQSVRHAWQAEDSLPTRGDDPWWLDFDPARRASFLRCSQLIAGQTAGAVVKLHRALILGVGL